MNEVDDFADVGRLLGQLVRRFAEQIVGGNDDDEPVQRPAPAVAPQKPQQLRPVLPSLVGDPLKDPTSRSVQEDHLVREEPVGGERAPAPLTQSLRTGRLKPEFLIANVLPP